MADHISSDNPHHLNTAIESGVFDEKATRNGTPISAKKLAMDEDEDEDMDALIDELESQDGHAEDDEEGNEAAPAGGRVVPEDQLQTDTRTGLTDAEVVARRKKYGYNQMKEEKENLVLKFLGYFIGPIQFVMEVGFATLFSPFAVTGYLSPSRVSPTTWGPAFVGRTAGRHNVQTSAEKVLTKMLVLGCRYSCCWPPRLGRFRCHLRLAVAQRLGRVHSRVPGGLDCRRVEEDAGIEGYCSS